MCFQRRHCIIFHCQTRNCMRYTMATKKVKDHFPSALCSLVHQRGDAPRQFHHRCLSHTERSSTNFQLYAYSISQHTLKYCNALFMTLALRDFSPPRDERRNVQAIAAASIKIKREKEKKKRGERALRSLHSRMFIDYKTHRPEGTCNA